MGNRFLWIMYGIAQIVLSETVAITAQTLVSDQCCADP